MEPPVREGEILANKYRVERVLGQGGMGVVVAARHVELDERVALKFLLSEGVSEPHAAARFLQEARAAARIKGEHVARVYDVGQLESGAPYIVMEYLEGEDLGAILRSRGPLPIEDAIDYVAQACEAIADAHAVGIVHRDLKPSNLMLVTRSDGSECIKVLDFGISKVSAKGGEAGLLAMTQTATALGSPLYMSPEQMMSARDVDGRTDIWALGTILYELLAGAPPFTAETLQALGVLIATAEPNDLRALRSDVPVGLEAVIVRCLAKRPDGRFGDVADLARALSPFAPARAQIAIERAGRILRPPRTGSRPDEPSSDRGSPRAPAEGAVRTATAYVPPHTGAGWGRTARGGSGRRKAVTATAVALVLLSAVGLGVSALLRGARAPSAAVSPGAPSGMTPAQRAISAPTAVQAPIAEDMPPEATASGQPAAQASPTPPRHELTPHTNAAGPAHPPSNAAIKPATAASTKSAYDDM